MSLSGQDITDLSKLLTDAVDFDTLEMYVRASTGDRLYDEYVAKNKPLRPTIFSLLEALENLGTTPVFLRYVYDRRPGKPKLRAAIAQRCPEALEASDKAIALAVWPADDRTPRDDTGLDRKIATTIGIAPGLQRNVRPYLPKVDLRVWLDRLTHIEHCVCRIEYNDNAAGTGFLVGPDTVLTNWHVYEAVRSAGKLDGLGCRFGYLVLPDGKLQFGELVPMHVDGCLDSGCYSNAEKTGTPEDPPPTADELDYALLRLSEAVGEEEINGTKRGWITLPDAALPLGESAPLMIVQHPEGSPMKLALDTQAVIGRNAKGNRLRYRTNTDPGSSGSPCFSMDWNIVALHHYGDPKWGNPLFNQGVPIELIRRRIESRGFGQWLGPP